MTRASLIACVRKWRRVFGIGDEWEIKISVHAPIDVPPEYATSYAWIDVDEQTMIADAHFNASLIDSGNVDLVVCHELTHIVTYRLERLAACGMPQQHADVALDAIERTVEQLARAFIRASSKGARK